MSSPTGFSLPSWPTSSDGSSSGYVTQEPKRPRVAAVVNHGDSRASGSAVYDELRDLQMLPRVPSDEQSDTSSIPSSATRGRTLARGNGRVADSIAPGGAVRPVDILALTGAFFFLAFIIFLLANIPVKGLTRNSFGTCVHQYARVWKLYQQCLLQFGEVEHFCGWHITRKHLEACIA